MKGVSAFISRISRADLADICHKYELPPELKAEAPENRIICNPPPGKVGVYLQLLNDGLRFPVSEFLLSVLTHFEIDISQLKPNGLLKINCYEHLCSALGLDTSLTVFRYFYHIKRSGHYWVSFDLRDGRPEIWWGSNHCNKQWKQEFIFISADSFPTITSRTKRRVVANCPEVHRLVKSVDAMAISGIADFVLAAAANQSRGVPRCIMNSESVTWLELLDDKYGIDAVVEDNPNDTSDL